MARAEFVVPRSMPTPIPRRWASSSVVENRAFRWRELRLFAVLGRNVGGCKNTCSDDDRMTFDGENALTPVGRKAESEDVANMVNINEDMDAI